MGFKKDFMWGAATAAYQIEGAYKEAGKGLGIWDVYSKLPGKIKNNENGNISCDHYHHYKEDIALMKKLGIKNYRFSISWPRVLPEGNGQPNEAGLKFYSDLVDTLIENDITPLVTLYHWNYPNALQQKGGWLSPESVRWFTDYTKLIVERLSDRVKYWITFNEPQVFTGLGYERGIHAPFYQLPLSELTQMSHHILLAHGKAVQTIRQYAVLKPIIGFAPTGTCTIPASSTASDIEKARKSTFDLNPTDFLFSNSWWADPIVLGCYPKKAFECLGEAMPKIQPGDMAIISTPIDFYGCNTYYGISPKSEWQGEAKTCMDWRITPDALYWSTKFFYERYKLPILITENGMAGQDWVYTDGHVHDPYRIEYTSLYLKGLKQAASEGVDILGYMHWSLIDNFEWAEGYSKRFGLIYVDYLTGKRILKDSAYWYQKVIESNGASL